MKNYLSILCVSFFMGMLALSAQAVDTPYYVSGNIGASLFSNITLNNPATQIQQGTFPTSASYAVESALGRDFDGFRVEVEAGLQQNKTTRIGAINVVSVLFNGYYDFSDPDELSPYVTAGIGYAGVTAVNYVSSSVLGYQVGAGVLIPISEIAAIDLRYRYFGTGTCNFIDNSSEFKLSGSSVLVGLKLKMR
jgi:opacity protein-like surface antigen